MKQDSMNIILVPVAGLQIPFVAFAGRVLVFGIGGHCRDPAKPGTAAL